MSLFWLESQQPIVTSLNLKVISRCPMDQRITEVRLLSLPLLLVCTTFSAALGNHTGRIKVVFTPTICKLTCIGGRCHNNCELGNTTTIISENGHATDTLTAPNFRVGKWSWRFVYFFFSYFFSGRISTEHTHTQAHLLTSKPYLTPVKQMNTLQNCLLWSLVSGIVHGHKIIVLQTCCWKKKKCFYSARVSLSTVMCKHQPAHACSCSHVIHSATNCSCTIWLSLKGAAIMPNDHIKL